MTIKRKENFQTRAPTPCCCDNIKNIEPFSRLCYKQRIICKLKKKKPKRNNDKKPKIPIFIENILTHRSLWNWWLRNVKLHTFCTVLLFILILGAVFTADVFFIFHFFLFNLVPWNHTYFEIRYILCIFVFIF